jgi:hypothetical protein
MQVIVIDATPGPAVRVGETVHPGTILGYRASDGSAVRSSVTGIVEYCTFDADRHLLQLHISYLPD